MCRTLLTVIHHACLPEHLTRQTRTERCYTAYLFGAHVCAPGLPRHRFYEQHIPGPACRSCFYPHHAAYNAAYNTIYPNNNDIDDDDDNYDVDPATLHNQRLLFRQQSTLPSYRPPYVPRPLAHLPAPVNPPYLGTGEHAHEQIPYVGPSILAGVPGARIDRPLIDAFAHEPPRDFYQQQSNEYQYPSDNDTYDGEEGAGNDGGREPAQFRGTQQQQRRRTRPARGPLVSIAEDEREDHRHRHDDDFYGSGTELSGDDGEAFVRVQRPTRFRREPQPQQQPPIARRRRAHLPDPSMPGFQPYSPPSSASSDRPPGMGNLRGGGDGDDGDHTSSSSGTQVPRMGHLRGGGGDDTSNSSGTNSPANNAAGEETEDEEDRQLREALAQSAREFAELEDAEQRRAAERSLSELGSQEDDALRRVAADSLREYADAEHAALVRAMHESAAEAEGEQMRSAEEDEREVLRRSVGTWREEVLRRMEQWEGQGRGERGSADRENEVEAGGQGGREEVRQGEMPSNWGRMNMLGGRSLVPDGDAGRSESTTAQTGHSTPEATSFEQDQAFHGRGNQSLHGDFSPPVHPNPTSVHEQHPSHTPAQRSAYPPPPTVEDDISEPGRPATWSFEGVIEKSQEQDDGASTIMDPAAEVTRAMEAVDMSLDSAAYVRKKRLARFAEPREEQ